MEARLHDYTENNPPELHLTKPILHPTNSRKVIGHEGRDTAASGRTYVATFPRRKDEHWFRGQSTSGLTGYGISEDVLESLSEKSVSRVLVIETDESRVIEYDLAAFTDATVVAYSPKLDECVIGDDAMRVDDGLFNDRQRVLPVSKARRTFRRSDITIMQ